MAYNWSLKLKLKKLAVAEYQDYEKNNRLLRLVVFLNNYEDWDKTNEIFLKLANTCKVQRLWVMAFKDNLEREGYDHDDIFVFAKSVASLNEMMLDISEYIGTIKNYKLEKYIGKQAQKELEENLDKAMNVVADFQFNHAPYTEYLINFLNTAEAKDINDCMLGLKEYSKIMSCFTALSKRDIIKKYENVLHTSIKEQHLESNVR